MSSGSTSRRSFRNSLKSLFDKRIHGSGKQQSGRLSEHDGESAPTGSHRPSNLQSLNKSESPTPPAPDTSPTTENRRDAASLAFEGTLRALHQSTEVFPPLQAAIGTLISGLEAIPVAEDHRRSYNSLLAELKTLHEGIDKYREKIELTGISDGMASIILSIEAETKFLKSKRDQGRVTGILGAGKDEDDLIRCYRRIEALSRQLQTNIGLGTWSVAYEQLMNTRLGALSPALLAGFNSTLAAEINRRMCTENTRVEVLRALDSWSRDTSAANVYWMSGMAGTGKTTIAATLSDDLFKQKRLGASFFCTRTSPECSSINGVVPTLAYQLARYSRPFQAVLGRILDNDPDIASREISLQFERLLKEPLIEIRSTIPSNIIVIIDALDECRDHDGVATLLNVLFQCSSSLPVKFFITSRPEPEIREQVLQQQEGKRDVFYLHDIEQSIVQADIELYLREELAFMSPAEYQIKQFAQLAGSLFIYAATVVRYIRPSRKLADSQSRLELVLSVKSKSKKQYAELDMLYTTILSAALDNDVLEPVEMERAKHVLWTSVCAREPISVETLADIVEINQGGVLAILQPFLSVLHFYEKEHRVSILHASFPDFIFNSERSGIHFCDQRLYGQRLTLRCFDIMKAQLRFNVCRFESSFIPDTSVTDIEQRAHSFISPTLSYASRYWGSHLTPATYSLLLVTEIEEFLAIRLLFWMEVLNVTKSTITGIMELQSARLWLLKNAQRAAPKALRLIEDAQDFVTSFSASSISDSTPHIYISALPFCPSSSTVSQNYRMRTRGLLNPKGGLFNNRDSGLLAIRRMPNSITCMSTSPDGTLIVIGDEGGMICILNQHDGTPIKSFVGHGKIVECISFSPDNLQFASGSFDATICCWSRNGSLVLGPLVGHTGGISSVAFSPDGKQIVSGGRDCTVRLWNAKNGSLISSSSMNLDNNDHIVTSTILSPDGAHLVSGLDSGALRIWDFQRDRVNTVAPSPHISSIKFLASTLDGTLVLSSSYESPICLWNPADWSPVTRTFSGSQYTSGIAVSADGSYVACSSGSGDIQLWNVATGATVAGPFESPMGPAISQRLAFSADGTRLFSAGYDANLCMWNIQRETPANTATPYVGHTAAIDLVSFSSDGKQIFSCAENGSVRIWKIDDCSLALSLELCEADSRGVSAVAVSQDHALVAASSYRQSINLFALGNESPITTFCNRHTKIIYSLSFSPNGKLLASGSADHMICIWDVQQGTISIEPLIGHTNIVNCVQFAPSGHHIASCSSDQTVCLWDATSGQLLRQLFSKNHSAVLSVSYSHDGDFIVAGDDGGKFQVWALADPSTTDGPVFFAEELDAISSVAFSPNGNLIATGSDDGAISVWDRYSGTLVAGPFKDHSEEVNAVAWSPDGNVIASCSSDQTIRLVDLLSLRGSPTWMEGDWELRDDGWMENQNQRLFWVSPDLHRVLPKHHNSLVIGPQGPALVDYGGLLLGEDWAQCYISSQ